MPGPCGNPEHGGQHPSRKSRCTRWRHKFHDFQLSRSVASARHAVAIDERRATFPAALWDNLDDLNAKNAQGGHDAYQQVWFPGGHGSVGGGGDITGLSDDALIWLLEGAAAQGLEVPKEFLDQARERADYKVALHNISNERWSLSSMAMSLVQRDRKAAADKAVSAGLLDVPTMNFAIAPAMKESELEDLYSVEVFRDAMLQQFGVDFSIKLPGKAQKWSDATARRFSMSGKHWDDKVKDKVKSWLAQFAADHPTTILEKHRTGPVENLIIGLNLQLGK